VIKVWIATHFDNASSHRESASGTKYSQLEKLIELGLTSAQIAEALGISLPNVRQIKKRLETRIAKESV
jgi:DNA-binding NarL/FixJ family response regulator